MLFTKRPELLVEWSLFRSLLRSARRTPAARVPDRAPRGRHDRRARFRAVHDAWTLRMAWVMAVGAIPWALLAPERLHFMVLYALLGAGFLWIGGQRANPVRRAVLGGSVAALGFLLRPEWTPAMSLGEEMLKILFEVTVFGIAGALVLFLRWRLGGGLPRAPANRDRYAETDSILGLPGSNRHATERTRIGESPACT